jgi:hypothetical protein
MFVFVLRACLIAGLPSFRWPGSLAVSAKTLAHLERASVF